MRRQCEVGRRWFSRCSAPAVGSCQYCGRAFCAQHGTLEDEYQEICNRPICREKQADVRDHLAYKQEAWERNQGLRCGHPDCLQRPSGQCSRCRLLFCESHLLERLETVRQGFSQITRPVSVCEHCAARLRLWSRR